MPAVPKKSSAQKGDVTDSGAMFSVGRIVGFHGLSGHMKIRPSCNNANLLLDVKEVQIIFADGSVSNRTVSEIYLDRRMLLIQLQDLTDRTSVEQFIDCSVSTTRAQLRELDKNEWWVDDLIGLPVYTTAGAAVGTVSDIIGANAELLEITRLGDKKGEPILVPFVEALVPVVDIENKRVEINDLPGLLDS